MAKDNFEDIWNCQTLKDVRKAMLAGQKLSGCKICHMEEANSRMSVRQQMNSRWENILGADNVKQRIEESQLHDGRVLQPPTYFDLRMGNKCNLKCRMCFPTNSHGLDREVKDIIAEGKAFPQIYKNLLVEENDLVFWGDSEKFLTSMDQALPHAFELYFTGGEPMLIQGTEKILKKACELGVAHKIKITFHTNSTLWNKNILELLPHFKEVCVLCSIDGVERVDEYIRYPTRFTTVEKNFKKYLEFAEINKNIYIGIGSAISWQNIFELPRFASWLNNLDVRKYRAFGDISFNMVYYPTFLNLKMIPEDLKAQALAAVQECLDRLKEKNILSARSQSDLLAIVDVLSRRDRIEPNDITDLIHQTQTLDEHRKQNLADYIPPAYRVYEFYKNSLSTRQRTSN